MNLLRPLLLAALATACLQGAEKPNIVLILADDIGYGDLGCYKATMVKTPSLDKLASQGCRFTDAHSPASTCTPTRRALLTGVYSWRQKPGSSIAPGDAPLSIPTDSTTLPSMLKQAGYRTGAVGKWHLGLGGENGPDWNTDIKPGPLEVGFDYAFFMPATGDRVPCVYVENHRIINHDPADPIKVSYKGKIGNEPTGSENPDQLTLKPTHGHVDTIVNGVSRIGWMTGGQKARWKDEDMADTYTSKALAFIEQSKDKPFFLYLATHNIHVPRVPNGRFQGTSAAGRRGDSIHELDETVGKVMAKLDELKLADNTLVIFTSDNGGVMDDGYEDVGNFDHKCNGVLRGFKGSLYEGGHRLPFIARWPGKINAGTESAAFMTHLDIVASMAALTGSTIPEGQCRDSINVLPYLLGEKTDKPLRETFVAHNGGTEGPFSLRAGQWKFIPAGRPQKANFPGAKAENRLLPVPQLYDLSHDLSETKNLAAEQPAKLAEMQALLAKLIQK
ncbi:MAG: arylsulfatase [Verrucomicrobiaceae bacterium]|nr:arylsulfatase [Verrucomicrobiaceae bacterium]